MLLGRALSRANAADVDFAVVHPHDVDISELATLDLNIYTTELFKLPAGGVGFAFGGQFRREQLTQEVDQINIDADLAGNSPAPAQMQAEKTGPSTRKRRFRSLARPQLPRLLCLGTDRGGAL